MEGIEVEARTSHTYVREHNRKQNSGVGCLQTTHMKVKHIEKFKQGSRRCTKQIQTQRNQWHNHVSSWINCPLLWKGLLDTKKLPFDTDK